MSSLVIDHLIAARRRLLAAILLMLCIHTPTTQSVVADEVSQATAAKEATSDWKKTGWPMVKRFCIDCHNADYQEAEIDLSLLENLDGTDSSSASMQRVLEMVRFGAMPPDDSDLPTDSERKEMVRSIDRALFSVVCDMRPRPGKVTARRLNRAEYNNSIRDLFGMDLRPADKFPSDEVGAGFDNNGDVLSLSPLQIEKYIAAAESVAEKVIIDPATLPQMELSIAPDQILVHGDTRTGSFNGRFLAPDAFAWVDVTVPVKGEYEVRVRGGKTSKGKPKTNVAVYDERGTLVELDDLEYYGGSGRADTFRFHVNLSKGKHRFAMEPLEEKPEGLKIGKTYSKRFDTMDKKVVRDAHERRKKPLKPDRDIEPSDFPFMLRSVEVEGPIKTPTHLLPPSQSKIIRRTASYSRGKWSKVEEAAKESLKPLMQRAFRSDVSDEEVARYAKLVQMMCDRDKSYYRGMQVAVSAILTSPRFLFRVETPPEDWKADGDDNSAPLTQHQLATRLSYFLWSSTPDDWLLAEAGKNRLNEKNMDAVVRRMLADPKSETLSSQFAAQWLGLRNLAEHEADTKMTFKDFDPKLIGAMSRETEMLFMHMVRENKPVAEMLTADYTFLNGDLARHYGMKLDAEEFQKVSLKGTPRRGILAHGSMLTLTSNPTRTSPVKRGKWILENVLGTPPPDPPANVPELDEAKVASQNASLREQMELHRESPSCSSCHRVMDQLGFGLEEFDAIGRYRKMDGKLKVDASGVLPGGRKFAGAAQLSDVLGKTEREAFAKTVTERLLTFAIGRELSPSDRCVVDEIVLGTRPNDFRYVDIILAVVRSRPFQFYDWQPPSPSS
ncbi:DUF1592 domain-containing protein [Planctomycetes bacterium K23_9]|uniref:Planctomycete cytochrome C n=1 Tax=Stieleria marina TaxID=1930275 RepID=A0A517NSS8_9BACT|nr:hypothetical protein K239x_21110 [Planctomycetes bacterium K23_9]